MNKKTFLKNLFEIEEIKYKYKTDVFFKTLLNKYIDVLFIISSNIITEQDLIKTNKEVNIYLLKFKNKIENSDDFNDYSFFVTANNNKYINQDFLKKQALHWWYLDKFAEDLFLIEIYARYVITENEQKLRNDLATRKRLKDINTYYKQQYLNIITKSDWDYIQQSIKTVAKKTINLPLKALSVVSKSSFLPIIAGVFIAYIIVKGK